MDSLPIPLPAVAPDTVPFVPQIRLYQEWLHTTRGLHFDSYDAMWRWSVTDLDAFWQSIWDYFDLQSPTPHSAVLGRNAMPGAQWFPGAQLNYAQQVLRHAEAAHAAGQPAIVARNEAGRHRTMSWIALRRRTAALALHLRAQGLQPGDRVAAYLPNVPETIVAFLAVASLGGIWSVCAPDMGTHAVLDRFRQIAPKVLIGCDGVRYGGRVMDRSGVLAELRAALPSVQHLIVLQDLAPDAPLPASLAPCVGFAQATARDDDRTAAFEPLWLPFDHPLWIVYSSGTTGLPKPIVHGHGGVMLVGLALTTLHNDLGSSYHPNSFGERFLWYSSTGWIVWNVQIGGLLGGTTVCMFDGNPGGPALDMHGNRKAPDWGTLWREAAAMGVTFVGAGAAYFGNCAKAGLDLRDCGDLHRVRALGTTGSPLSEEAQNWGTRAFRQLHPDGMGPHGEDIWWCNVSGGTDFAGAFIGGNRELPQVPGQMQCRMLGASVEAWNEQGEPLVDAVGELVCTQPLPSMPLYFWGDEGGKRYLSSYFDTYPEGHGRAGGTGSVWRHGDWLRVLPTGACIIYGRSDATINRHGLRMGTSEIYSAVEALPEVLDSMVVDLEYLGRPSYMPLFVVLRPGAALDDPLRQRIHQAIRDALSPRFLPNDIFKVAEIPRTLSGKKQELPIKKLLLGQPLDKVLNRDAMANPGCLEWYARFAADYAGRTAGNGG